MSPVLVGVIVKGLTATACFVGAAVLAFHDKGAWGWLIFAGIICISFSVKGEP